MLANLIFYLIIRLTSNDFCACPEKETAWPLESCSGQEDYKEVPFLPAQVSMKCF